MNYQKSLKLIQKYSECPNCGNDKVGNGQGTLDINDDTFIRTCKCGCTVKVKGDENKCTY
ncbi:DUF3797 domain-containing protein [Virgibacillus sp. W0430]|uniref:DUF3797 domain-containing protein n=1 Tax=Virgibacillus sp. W0430 TaxID=3391580 RepID=UPI003F4519F0